MSTHSRTVQQEHQNSVSVGVPRQQVPGAATLADNRPAAVSQRKLADTMQHSATTVAAQRQAGSMAASTARQYNKDTHSAAQDTHSSPAQDTHSSPAQDTHSPAQLETASVEPAAQLMELETAPVDAATQLMASAPVNAARQASPVQLMASSANVAQLNPIEWAKEKYRQYQAKKAKLQLDASNAAMGVVHGRGIDSRYSALNPKSEKSFYNDGLDEEAAGDARMEASPVLETGRKVVNFGAGKAIGAGADALNAVAPMAGTVAGKVAGMGKDKLNKMAKEKLQEGTNPYTVLRDDDEEED